MSIAVLEREAMTGCRRVLGEIVPADCQRVFPAKGCSLIA